MDKYIKYGADIKIVESSVTKLNPQFSLCDVLVCYHGDNRNHTSMSKETINDAIYSLYGIPIIGEWLYDTSEETWGSHGGKIIISDKGIEFEETTKPYGFVTKEAVDNADWVTIVEDDGHTQHEYLQLKGCILWTDRYDEAQSVLKENFGQSMEIEILDGAYRENSDYYDISKFVFSALCILGTAEPCFESASIGKHYEQNGFAEEISKMKKAYAKFIEEKKTAMNEKVYELLGNRYAVLSIGESEIICVDREDNFKLLAIPYSIADEEVSIDYDKASERYFASTEEHNDFSIANEINSLVESKTSEAIEEHVKGTVESFEAEMKEAEDKYVALLNDYNVALSRIAEYEQAEQEREEASHRAEVDAKVEEYSDRLKHCAEYLLYRTKLDYTKTVDEVDVDLTMILGNYSKNKKDKKSGVVAYSAYIKPQDNDSREQERYGTLLENVK